MQGIVLMQGILHDAGNCARRVQWCEKGSPSKRGAAAFLAFTQPGVSKARLMLSFAVSGDAARVS